jgi:3-ketosteroid 9alpha-monooxygenase subunit B
MKKALTLRIAEVLPQGRDAVLLSLSAEDGGTPNLRFVPGQYLTVAANVDGGEHWRCYSITSEPGPDRPISVLVRRVAGGLVSNWICDYARAGRTLRVLPPAGRFTLARYGNSVVLFAGGSGIAPIYALARQALQEGAPKVSLFYANRDRGTSMMMEDLAALERSAGDRLQLSYWFDSETGLPTAQDLQASARGLAGVDVYLCGPDAFMKAVRESMQQLGFDDGRLYVEDFGKLSEQEAVGDDDREAVMTVQVRGQVHDVVVKGKQSLLSAMLGAGLQVPHSCKVGECASCMCRLLEGEVERLENSVLDEDDLAEGWILACSSRIVSTRIRVRIS